MGKKTGELELCGGRRSRFKVKLTEKTSLSGVVEEEGSSTKSTKRKDRTDDQRQGRFEKRRRCEKGKRSRS